MQYTNEMTDFAQSEHAIRAINLLKSLVIIPNTLSGDNSHDTVVNCAKLDGKRELLNAFSDAINTIKNTYSY